MRYWVIVMLLATATATAWAEPAPRTYCNPLNLDYAYTPKLDYSLHNAHRSTADPACVYYQGRYWLFSTNQEGYWWSKDLGAWHFVSQHFKHNTSQDDVCAPALWATSRGLMMLPCFGAETPMPLYVSTDPLHGPWRQAVASFPIPQPGPDVAATDERRSLLWDPSIFEDDDHRFYLYWGSSNQYPIRGVELDPDHGYVAKGPLQNLIFLDPMRHGWECFGEDNQHGTMDPFIEGAWMNRFGNRYYLQYGAPGTEWNVYGDGVFVSDHPLGPFTYQAHNPFSWKPTGFLRGAGHGSTFPDAYGNLWHVATGVIAVKYKFERRIGLYPAGVDADGTLFADTAFGDYPHWLPHAKWDPQRQFTGWMLLSYRKKAWASIGGSDPALAFDESIKTYWCAPDAKPGRWLAVDLGAADRINAIQINYADDHATLYGKQLHVHHRYRIEASLDNQHWWTLVDKSANDTDVPHDYVELAHPATARYLKLVHLAVPTGRFAISGFRVFGHRPGPLPSVPTLSVQRDPADPRAARLTWHQVPGAYAYAIAFGTGPRRYSSLLVYDADHYDLHGLNTATPYTFTIQAVSESGLSAPSPAVSAQ